MDLNKVCIYTSAVPKPLLWAAKWSKEDETGSHEQNRSNGATCLPVSATNIATVQYEQEETWERRMNEWRHFSIFIASCFRFSLTKCGVVVGGGIYEILKMSQVLMIVAYCTCLPRLLPTFYSRTKAPLSLGLFSRVEKLSRADVSKILQLYFCLAGHTPNDWTTLIDQNNLWAKYDAQYSPVPVGRK